jgi:hypothetical protein
MRSDVNKKIKERKEQKTKEYEQGLIKPIDKYESDEELQEKSISTLLYLRENIELGREFGIFPDSSVKSFRVKLDYNLKAFFPDVIEKYWDYESNGILLPEYLGPSSARMVYWICNNCGERYKRRCDHQVWRGNGCMNCENRKMDVLKREKKIEREIMKEEARRLFKLNKIKEKKERTAEEEMEKAKRRAERKLMTKEEKYQEWKDYMNRRRRKEAIPNNEIRNQISELKKSENEKKQQIRDVSRIHKLEIAKIRKDKIVAIKSKYAGIKGNQDDKKRELKKINDENYVLLEQLRIKSREEKRALGLKIRKEIEELKAKLKELKESRGAKKK